MQLPFQSLSQPIKARTELVVKTYHGSNTDDDATWAFIERFCNCMCSHIRIQIPHTLSSILAQRYRYVSVSNLTTILSTLYATCWGWAASYQPPPQVANRGTTFRYGGQLRTKRTLVVWRISGGVPAVAVSSERGGGSRVALSTATKYPHALWRHCDTASLSRQKRSSATAALWSGS